MVCNLAITGIDLSSREFCCGVSSNSEASGAREIGLVQGGTRA